MLVSLKKDISYLVLLGAVSAVLLGLNLGRFGLLDPDEPFYALTAKEMIQSSDPWTPRMFGEPQFEKPVFFYWVLYASFKLFGISEWSARLGPCLAGILTVLTTYLWGRSLYKRPESALLSALVLATTGQFIVLSRIVLTDIFLCLFVTAALASFTWGMMHERRRSIAWHLFFLFCGLGFLTKGPLGLLIPLFGIVPYACLTGERALIKAMPWKSGLLVFSVTALPWYALMTWMHGPDFLTHFFLHENVRRFFVAEHQGMDQWLFYPGVFALGFFPWSAVALGALAHSLLRGRDRGVLYARRWLFPAFCTVVPAIFFMAAKSKLLSYIFPIFPSAALLCGPWLFLLARAWGRGYKTEPIFRSAHVFFWGAAPLALVAGAIAYSERHSLQLDRTVLTIALTWIPCSWMAVFFFLKRKLAQAVAWSVLGTLFFAGFSFGLLLPALDNDLSTRSWQDPVKALEDKNPSAPFFASKLFVRGLAYYSDPDQIGVFSNSENGDFYTRPEIPIFSDVEKFLSAYRQKLPAFLMIRQKEFKHLKRHLSSDYSISVVGANSQRMLVRLERV